MSASSSLKRIKWRQAYRQSVAAGVSFADQLEDIEDSIAEEVESNKDVASTTTGQHSVTFFKGFDTQDRADLILFLQDTYTEARANLIEDGTVSPTDAQIYAEGDEYLKDPSDVETDFSGIRCARSALV